MLQIGTVQDAVMSCETSIYESEDPGIHDLMVRSIILITNKAFGQEDATLYMWSSGVLACAFCHGMPITTCGMAVQVTIIFYSHRGLDYQLPIKILFISPFTSVPAFLSPNSEDPLIHMPLP